MNIMSPAGFEWGAVSEPVYVTAQVVPVNCFWLQSCNSEADLEECRAFL